MVIKIPLPKNTAVATVNAASGKCKYAPEPGRRRLTLSLTLTLTLALARYEPEQGGVI